ncbi:DUF6493 family protein [Herbidospora sp. NBRC 101105]|uniref:DUF6493 family protein n=1 Tax=Herbidospora sp. NBRC 101105 TaxID=3032195 RepID=UPI0024A2C8CB|nr:DUF6493 family protein [Herbidospora sp. NBRC 101105]GLX97102.1 hypothetical protein Hesp01_50520 [Herbidospora sp. NBRC 101105]
MNAWEQVRKCVEAGDDAGLAAHVGSLTGADRRAVAEWLPRHLAGLSRGEAAGQASGLRVAGAACFSGAAQVAAWLDRRDLRLPQWPRDDAERVAEVLRARDEAWRRDLAHRLVTGLRPGDRRGWQNVDGQPGYDLAARLAIETGIEPPENDAFVVGWLWDVCHRFWRGGRLDVLRDDPFLDVLTPRLFTAEGAAAPLIHDWKWNRAHNENTAIGALADLAAEGRLDRRALLDGCVARFLTHGHDRDIEPFTLLWERLRPEPAEVPVVDLIRVLPVAANPLVLLAVGELGRVPLDAGLFGEAVGALAFRPEKKHVTTALQWIALARPEEADGALAALAVVFAQETPSLRDRAVRLALKLAPHASPEAVGAIRASAAGLPAELRDQIAGAFGGVEAVEAEPSEVLTPGELRVTLGLPPLPPEIGSPAELAGRVGWGWRSYDPVEVEQIMAALVAFTHVDREATLDAVRPWCEKVWGRDRYVDHSSLARHVGVLLTQCALALVNPAESAELSGLIDEVVARDPRHGTPFDRFTRDRVREVIALLESGRTVPVLLATPTEPSGHVAAATLVDRVARLGDAEPLPLDFWQALLRLPRTADPEVVARAGRLTSPAGRRLAAWLRDGGLADPEVSCAVATTPDPDSYDDRETSAAHAVMRPAVPGLPEPIAALCTLEPEAWNRHSDEIRWWPTVLPSHREVVAAHVLECFVVGVPAGRARVSVLRALVQGGGPVGRATASAVTMALGHKNPAQRDLAVEAITILAVRGELAAADFGWALAQSVRSGAVTLKRATPALEELVFSGAHRETWAILAEALPPLLGRSGGRPVHGMADLLGVAVKAAVLAGARGEVPGLAEAAARKATSRVTDMARVLLDTIGGPE